MATPSSASTSRSILSSSSHPTQIPKNKTSSSSSSTHRTRGRPRIRGDGRRPNQALRTPVTYAHKLAVIDFYEAHARDINATANEFYSNLNPSALASRKRQIYKWVKEREMIEEMCFRRSTAGQKRRRDKGTGTSLSAEAEGELASWIQVQCHRMEAGALSTTRIREKAIEVAEKHGVPKGSFQATWSWQKGFFARHPIVQPNPSDGASPVAKMV